LVNGARVRADHICPFRSSRGGIELNLVLVEVAVVPSHSDVGVLDRTGTGEEHTVGRIGLIPRLVGVARTFEDEKLFKTISQHLSGEEHKSE
jgi:hypothetical protein